VRPPSLYNHVKGLGDLRAAVALSGIVALGDRMTRAAVGRAGDEALFAIGRAYREFARDFPGRYMASIRWMVPGNPQHDAQVGRAVEVVTQVLASYGLHGHAALHATRVLRSGLHGFVSLEGMGGFALELDQDASFDWFLEAFSAICLLSSAESATLSRRNEAPQKE